MMRGILEYMIHTKLSVSWVPAMKFMEEVL